MPAPEPFLWPPRPADSPHQAAPTANPKPSPPASPPAPPQPRPPAPASWWRHVETTFLGLTDEPLADRCARAGWQPDPPDAYCARCGSTVGPFEARPPPDLDDLHAAGPADQGPSCPACRNRRLPWERAVRLGPYEGELREMIHQVKFQRWRRLGSDLGRLLAMPLRHALTDAGIDPRSAVLVPVPMSFRRRWMRGIDHTLVIARALADALPCPLVRALRRRHRPTQWSVPASARRANVRGAFVASPARVRRLAGRTLIVLDDLRTTGATLTECCRCLREAHRRGVPSGEPARPLGVWTAVLAVTPDPGRPGASPGDRGRPWI